MSNIPTKKIDGDVTIGRNTTIGGDTRVRGNATIGGNLRVQGWLEAKNIKTVNKGLFRTPQELNALYPRARLGWYAGVEASTNEIETLGLSVAQGKTLYRMYLGTPKGNWEARDRLYEINVELIELTELSSEVRNLHAEHNELHSRIDTNDNNINRLETRVTEHDGDINRLERDIEDNKIKDVSIMADMTQSTLSIITDARTTTQELPVASTTQVGLMTPEDKTTIENNQRALSIAQDDLTALQDSFNAQSERITNVENRHDADMLSVRDDFSRQMMSVENKCMADLETVTGRLNEHLYQVGKAGGVAQLDDSGRVPARQLPGYVDDVVEFETQVTDVAEVKDETYAGDSTDTFVLWLSKASRRIFVLAVYHEDRYLDGSDAELNDTSIMGDFLRVLVTKDDEVRREYINDRCEIYQSWSEDYKYQTGGRLSHPYEGKLYVETLSNGVYRWSGSALVVTNQSLALGETNATAYPGNLGKATNAMARQANTTANEALDKAVANSRLMTNLDVEKQPRLRNSEDIVVSDGGRLMLSDSVKELLSSAGSGAGSMTAEDGEALANEVFN